ncbi:RICIN domain-containing protein [Saccharothrix sp. NRRL B-16314]|uniref:RICIN domain-containing protein n=1 Tax=Saccharothrix sp. NRRL B-16314 TaxID=1463825 RepID=UPI000525E699|nr:RICIN domain-containing protein [Saccharothrix sp. NRRL B-16314]
MRKRILTLLAASVAVAGAVAVGGPSAQAAVPVANTTYTVAVTNSGKCLDVPYGEPVDELKVQQWTCSSATMQQWVLRDAGSGLFTMTNVASGKCLDIPHGATTMYLQAQQYSCWDGQMQKWRLTPSGSGTYQVVNAQSGLCLANKDAGKDNGVPVVQETCTANSNKQWLFTPVGGRSWSNAADGFAAGTTGGAGGQTVTATNYADLVRYASSSAAHTIRVDRAITVAPYGTEIRVASNKTIIGVGTAGQIVNGGFNLDGVSNVIIRNLTIRDTRMADDDPGDDGYDYDGIQVDASRDIWIDHNTIVRMNDGLIDLRKDSTDVTVSWNRLGENNKAFGIGWTTNVTARMTIHHNWMYNNNSRNPSTDNVANAHLYNNYMQNITGYGNYARGSTKMVIENTYYDKVKDPYYRDDTAQLRQSGSVVVNSTGQRETGGNAFDPRSFYAYALDPAADVPNLVRAYSGPQADIGR